MIHIRELEPRDAVAVARLESGSHDDSLIDNADAHRRHIEDALAESVNLCFGAFDDDRLVGYLLCYGFEPTSFEEESGSALYVEDVTVEAGRPTVLARLLRRLLRDVNAHFSGVAVEAHAIHENMETWLVHARWFSRLGFDVTRSKKTGESVAGQDRYAIRWEQAAKRRGADGIEALLDVLPSFSVELNGAAHAVKVIRRESDWDALEPIWDSLLLAAPGHTVFQSYRYQRLWWKHLGSQSELFIVLILRGDKIAAIAPLRTAVVKRFRRHRRELSVIGTRWEVDRPLILFPEESPELIGVLARFLVEQKTRWEVADFYEQPAGSETVASLVRAFRAEGLLAGTDRDSDCAYLALGRTWQEFLAAKSQKLRKNLKVSRRRLAEIGEVRYRVYDALPEVREQLERYRQLEQRSWKDAEGAGIERDDAYSVFVTEMAEVFGRGGEFVIRTLSAGERMVAATFGLVFDGVFYSLQITHDRELDRCSPGTYLESLEIEECFARGYREYEFLGGFLNNKLRWTSTFRYTTQARVFRRTPALTAVYVLLFWIKPLLKEALRPFMKSWPKRAPGP